MAVAALIGAGLATAAPSTAHALPIPTVAVPCSVSSLISAIQAANLLPAQILNLAPFCTYSLAASAVTGTRGPDGLPIITGHVTLAGYGTTIKRFAAAKFRILEVATGGVLNAQGITIAGGDAGSETGGGILNARGTVVLTSVAVARNTADSGAGISNDRGGVTLTYTSVRGNTTGGGGGGGGIYNDGNLSLRYSKVTSNSANTNGGGIFNEQTGNTTLIASTVSGNNAAANGGGIYNNAGSSVGLESSYVYGNTADVDGAGISNLGTLRVLRSRLLANRAARNGGGLFHGVGATTLFYRSTVDRNIAASGGGINNAGALGSVTLTGSAVTANVVGNCVPLGTITGCTG